MLPLAAGLAIHEWAPKLTKRLCKPLEMLANLLLLVLIAYGATRDQAIRRMRVALSEMVVQGIDTNIPLHQDLLTDTRFLRGGTSIHYLEQKLAQMAKRVPPK